MRVAVFASMFLLFAGCAFLDKAVGLGEDGSYSPESSPVESVGRLSSLAGLPWVGMALSALGGLYADFRRRKYVKAGRSLTSAVDVILSKLEEGKSLSREAVVAILVEYQKKMSAEKEVDRLRS